MPHPLTDAEITEELAKVPGWTRDGDRLVTHYRMSRFKVVPFYTAVALAEDELDHHAGASILYGTVDFAVNTHDAGDRITALDFTLAARINEIAALHAA